MAQTNSLPPRPNLEYLKKQAKNQLKILRQSNAIAKLADAQLAVARNYGFSSWRSLKLHMDSIADQPAAIDPGAVAEQALHQMDRGWAESCAIIERRFDAPGDKTRWETLGLESPTLRERDADHHIINRKVMGQYRMISVWLDVKVETKGKSIFLEPIHPIRALEFLQPGKAASIPPEGIWRRIDWKPSNQGFSGKPPRWDDLTEALTYVHDQAEPGEYRIITIRRMLFAQQLKDRIKIDKKHAGLTTLERIEKSVMPAKQEWSVESLPERRKSHKIVQWKPIMDAAFCGNVQKVKTLLDGGADPNVVSTTPHRYRPLHRAIEHKKTHPKHDGHERVVKLLLERGADPKLRATGEKPTALQLATMGEPRFIPLLRNYFEPLDIFHAAALADEKRVSALLKENPPLVKLQDENGWTALHYCCASVLHRDDPTISKALANIARMLLKAGADPMSSWEFNGTWPLRPLYYACGRSNHPAVARVLLEAGADPCDGESVYHASDEGHTECLALFEEFVDPKKLARECTSSLNVQLHWGRIRGMKWLLQHGADPTWVNPNSKMSALEEAIKKHRNQDVIDLLKQYSAAATPRSERRAHRARRRVRRARE